MGRARRAVLPDDATEVESALAAASAKLAALATLGVPAPELETKVDEGRAALEAGELGAAQSRADEVRIVVKLAANELGRMLAHGDPALSALAAAPATSAPVELPAPEAEAAAEPERAAAPEADLSDEVRAVVEDAFGKALYSNALRQMVEIVAAERLREFLQDAELMGPIVARRVREEMRAALAEEQVAAEG